MDISTGESVPVFLTDLLPQDEKKSKKGKKQQNWDTRKTFTNQVSELLDGGTIRHQKLSARMQECAKLLIFGWALVEAGVSELKFRKAHFCRVRNCPVCQWRRSQMLLARFFEAFPRIRKDYPTTRYVFLTLTVKNCPVDELRATIQHMNKAWNRLACRKAFPAIGYIRSLEVTKEKDRNYAHPHFHILLALKPSYFSRGYLSTADWSELWQNALRVDYTPVCDVRIVKAKKSDKTATEGEMDGIRAAIAEVFKYTVKPSDMVQDAAFLLELVNQLHKLRAVSLGGIFKEYLQEVEEEDQTGEETEEQDTDGGLAFGWRSAIKRYQLNPPN